MIEMDLTAQEWKEKGNEEFMNGYYDKALACYTNALNLTKEDNLDKIIYLKNRAAVYLKQNNYSNVIKDCDEVLKFFSNDPKALFRRCQALEAIGRYEEAYRDACAVITADPSNKAIQPIIARLHEICQKRLKENSKVSAKVTQMFKLAFDLSKEQRKRESAMNNLLVLAKEKVGVELMFKQGISIKIQKLLKTEKNESIIVAASRIMAELCKDSIGQTDIILKDIGIPWFLNVINSNNEERVNSGQYCIQAVLNNYSGMNTKPNSKPNIEMCEKYKKELDTILSCLLCCTTNRTFTGKGRDAVIELIMRNIHYDSLNWAEQLVAQRGLQRLMEVASELEEYKYESAIEITSSTRSVTSVCLARIYESMYYDAAKEKFIAAIDEFIKDKLLSPGIESKSEEIEAPASKRSRAKSSSSSSGRGRRKSIIEGKDGPACFWLHVRGR